MQTGRSHVIGVVPPQAKVHQRVPQSHWKLGEAWNRRSLAALRETQPYPCLDLRLLASRTAGQEIPVADATHLWSSVLPVPAW